ncbi:hypothetical protein [Thermodesulfovibrio yellowstonii]|uniref:hypothetical protein n=1 Tax=Thermodesulfovibrio yellowstonii TaxID=28262 RepID=UPI003C7E1FC1
MRKIICKFFFIFIISSLIFFSLEISINASPYNDCLNNFNQCIKTCLSNQCLDDCEIKYKNCADNYDSNFSNKQKNYESLEEKIINYINRKEEEFQACLAECDKRYNIATIGCNVGFIAQSFSKDSRKYGGNYYFYNSCMEESTRDLDICYYHCKLKKITKIILQYEDNIY